jgi:hypothetical protein
VLDFCRRWGDMERRDIKAEIKVVLLRKRVACLRRRWYRTCMEHFSSGFKAARRVLAEKLGLEVSWGS